MLFWQDRTLSKWYELCDMALLEAYYPAQYYEIGSMSFQGLTFRRFTGSNLQKSTDHARNQLVDSLRDSDHARDMFLRACLEKMGLSTSKQALPALTPLHIFFLDSMVAKQVTANLILGCSKADGSNCRILKGEQSRFQMQIPRDDPFFHGHNPADDEGLTTSIVIHAHDVYSPTRNPGFDEALFFRFLLIHRSRQILEPSLPIIIGETLIYSQVIDSTNTLLEQNPTLVARLPDGAVLTSETQLSGRGRGSNAWVSPNGSLLFSIVLRHDPKPHGFASVIWFQYIAAMAVVDGVKKYRPSYDDDESQHAVYGDVPIYIKWPNDIYIRKPSKNGTISDAVDAHVKIGGILVNSSYVDNVFTLIIGVGLNVSNAEPTTCLHSVLESMSPWNSFSERTPYQKEGLVASILKSFENYYHVFLRHGFKGELESTYYGQWLHSGQIVKLDGEEGGADFRINGITRDTGCLVVELFGRPGEEHGTGTKFQLQPDTNSFNFFKGLIKKKL